MEIFKGSHWNFQNLALKFSKAWLKFSKAPTKNVRKPAKIQHYNADLNARSSLVALLPGAQLRFNYPRGEVKAGQNGLRRTSAVAWAQKQSDSSGKVADSLPRESARRYADRPRLPGAYARLYAPSGVIYSAEMQLMPRAISLTLVHWAVDWNSS